MRSWLECGLLAGLLLGAVPVSAASVTEAPGIDCRVSAEQAGLRFPVDRLDPALRCLIGEVINGYTTFGVIEPVQTPIAPDLYVYLIDRPVLLASLLHQLEMASYQLSKRGPNRYWVNDGDGTQGLLRLLYYDETSRIYYVDGFHEGRIFPMVRGRAVVFLKLFPVLTADRSTAVSATLVSYTRLNDPVLAGLVRILRGLVGGAVTRKLVRGFELTNQLGKRIATEPAVVLQQVNSLLSLDPKDGQMLKLLLQAVPAPVSAVRPQRAAPVPP